MSLGLASKYLGGLNPKKPDSLAKVACGAGGDALVASVVNQKIVTQNVQQVFIVLAVQVVSVIEAQVGVAVNNDADQVDGLAANGVL